MPETNQEIQARIQNVITRNEYARQIIAGFRSAMPTLSEVWDYLTDALNDVLVLDACLSRDCRVGVSREGDAR